MSILKSSSNAWSVLSENKKNNIIKIVHEMCGES